MALPTRLLGACAPRPSPGRLGSAATFGAGVQPARAVGLSNSCYGLERVKKRGSCGLYRLADAEEFSYPDLWVVAAKAPDAVVCLISALSFHEITTQIPGVVHLAVSRGRYAGLRLGTPPVKIYRFDATTFDQGIEIHEIDGVTVRIYGVARTLVDCFKYRNKLGLDVAIEALRFARERKRISNREILHFARLLHQVRVISPYLEGVT